MYRLFLFTEVERLFYGYLVIRHKNTWLHRWLFRYRAESPVAQLYSTSTMEHHHFDQCVMILNSEVPWSLLTITTRQTGDIHPVLVQCWPTIYDTGPTLKQYWINVYCFATDETMRLIASQGQTRRPANTWRWTNVGLMFSYFPLSYTKQFSEPANAWRLLILWWVGMDISLILKFCVVVFTMRRIYRTLMWIEL